MNKCRFKGSSTPYGCFAVNASVRENGEVWCHQHYPPNVANRKRNPQRLALYPKLLETLSKLVAAEEAVAGAEEIDFHQLQAMREVLAGASAVIAQAGEIEA